MDLETNALRERLAALEKEVAALRASRPTPAPSRPEAAAAETMSRRAVLGRLGGMAVVGLGAMAVVGSSAAPAAADTGDPLIIGLVNGPGNRNPDTTTLQSDTGTNTDPSLKVENGGAGDGIVGVSAAGWGVMGSSSNLNAGVNGTGPALGVEGIGDTGVLGTATNAGVGVRGGGVGGIGVLGEGDTGLQGLGFGGPGVRASSSLDHGVTSSCDRINKAAVLASPTGNAYGLWANTVSTAPAIRVDAFGSGGGERISTNSLSSSATGLEVSVAGKGIGADVSAATGIGIRAKGKRAPLQLVPASVAGRPTSLHHSRGELIVDNTGALFLCTAPGTPGDWVKVNVTPA
jgi:hypothetical protein